MSKRTLLGIAAAICIVAVILLVGTSLFSSNDGQFLVLTNDETGKTIQEYEIHEGSTFSVSFVHSVNKSPYSDMYEIKEGKIYMTGLIYYGFGAGVPEELDPSWELSYGKDGEMILGNMDMYLEAPIYIVGTVSDHKLKIDDNEEISLRDLCGKNCHVKFSLKGF